MAGEPLSAQPVAQTGNDADFYYIVQSGQTRKQTRVQLKVSLNLGTAAAGTLTTTTLDSTVGRVLKVGDGGWLSTPVPLTEANMGVASVTSERMVTTAGLGTLPVAQNSYLYNVQNASAGFSYQTVIPVTTTRMFLRTQSASVFSGWAEFANSLNSFACTQPIRPGQFTLTTLPNAATFSGYEIDVTNATGGPKRCRSNGTVWQILNTTTTVS